MLRASTCITAAGDSASASDGTTLLNRVLWPKGDLGMSLSAWRRTFGASVFLPVIHPPLETWTEFRHFFGRSRRILNGFLCHVDGSTPAASLNIRGIVDVRLLRSGFVHPENMHQIRRKIKCSTHPIDREKKRRSMERSKIWKLEAGNYSGG
jgi:hypothetical protein